MGTRTRFLVVCETWSEDGASSVDTEELDERYDTESQADDAARALARRSRDPREAYVVTDESGNVGDRFRSKEAEG